MTASWDMATPLLSSVYALGLPQPPAQCACFQLSPSHFKTALCLSNPPSSPSPILSTFFL